MMHPMLRPQTMTLTALLALLTAFGPISTDMYVPSMPDIGRQLGASLASVQLTLSSYLAGFAIGQIIYGPIADRFGRKPTLLTALVLFGVASFICAIASTIEMLVIARAFQALGGAAAVMLPRAVVRDLYTGERAGQELSRMGAIMSFAPVVAPLVGALVQTELGWRATFVIIAAIGVVTTAMVWRALPETLPPDAAKPVKLAVMLRRYRAIVSNRAFLAHLGIIASSYAGLFAWISGSPFVLQDLYSLTPLWFGVAFAIACVGSLVGAAAASWLVMRIGLDRTIGLGTFVLAAGGLTMVASLQLGLPPIMSLVLSMVIYHTGLMLAMPQSIAGALMPFPDCAGTASSVVGFTQQASAAAIGVLVGLMLGHSAWPLAVAIAAMGCLSLVIWAASRRIRAHAISISEPERPHRHATALPAAQPRVP